MAAKISAIFFYKKSENGFFIKNANLTKKNLAGGRGGAGGVSRVSDFFQKNPSLKKNGG